MFIGWWASSLSSPPPHILFVTLFFSSSHPLEESCVCSLLFEINSKSKSEFFPFCLRGVWGWGMWGRDWKADRMFRSPLIPLVVVMRKNVLNEWKTGQTVNIKEETNQNLWMKRENSFPFPFLQLLPVPRYSTHRSTLLFFTDLFFSLFFESVSFLHSFFLSLPFFFSLSSSLSIHRVCLYEPKGESVQKNNTRNRQTANRTDHHRQENHDVVHTDVQWWVG